MPVGWLLLTWPTPRDSRSALRFSPMPRTSSKTWLSPITGFFWMAWPRMGATLTPPSRDAASWMACPTERGRSMAWKQTQWRRLDLTVGHWADQTCLELFLGIPFFFSRFLPAWTFNIILDCCTCRYSGQNYATISQIRCIFEHRQDCPMWDLCVWPHMMKVGRYKM